MSKHVPSRSVVGHAAKAYILSCHQCTSGVVLSGSVLVLAIKVGTRSCRQDMSVFVLWGGPWVVISRQGSGLVWFLRHVGMLHMEQHGSVRWGSNRVPARYQHGTNAKSDLLEAEQQQSVGRRHGRLPDISCFFDVWKS